MIAFHIKDNELLAAEQRTADAINPDDVAAVGGRAVAGFLRDYLFNLNSERHRGFAGSRGFYAEAARSVQNPKVAAGVASVAINHLGLAQRFFGGTIKAGSGISSKTGLATKLLAVGTDEAQGFTPWETAQQQDMAYVPTKRGGALVQGLRSLITRGPHKGDFTTKPVAGGLVLYWLVPEVTQEPDETVLPGELAMMGCARDAMGEYVDRKMKP